MFILDFFCKIKHKKSYISVLKKKDVMKRLYFILLFSVIIFAQENKMNATITVDSNISFEEAVAGIEFPVELKKKLTLIDVLYFGFDDKIHKGQIVVSKDLSGEVKEIFDKLLAARFPVEKVIPIVEYGWDDIKSMEDNNSSAFNYRVIAGTDKLSNHSYGVAIDINPLQNPYITKSFVQPEGAEYNPEVKGTITPESVVVKVFKKYGWSWGGDWTTKKDYQHFEKGN